LYSLSGKGPVRFLQVTDTHLFSEPKQDLLGIETKESFDYVLKEIRANKEVFDMVMLSGDLSQDGSLLAYQYLADQIRVFNKPSFWFCGNHDKIENMKQVATSDELEQVVRTEHWQIVMLNSQVVGSVFGHLEDDQLEILRSALEERPDLNTLISFHHHPIDMKCDWLDNIGVKNADKLFEIIKPYDNVRAILWGHVHQESDQVIDGVRMMSTPSTCIQFKPKQTDFGLDDIAPGYRMVQLNDDGSIDTEVKRVTGIEFNVDHSAGGY